MIPFDFSGQRIAPFCVEYLKTLSSDHPYFTSYVTQCVPFECIVCATNPRFLVSDKYHTIQCEFTKKALINFKRNCMYAKMSAMKGKYLVLQRYFPHCVIQDSTVKDIYLVVTAFSMVRTSNVAYGTAPNARPIIAAEELSPILEIVQGRCFRKAMELREPIGMMMQIELLLTDPTKATVSPLVFPPQSDTAGDPSTEGSKLLQEVADSGMAEMLEKDDRILAYHQMDQEERNAESEVKKIRYQRFNHDEAKPKAAAPAPTAVENSEKGSDVEAEAEIGKDFVREGLDPDIELELSKELGLTVGEAPAKDSDAIKDALIKCLEARPRKDEGKLNEKENAILERVAEISAATAGPKKSAGTGKARDISMGREEIREFEGRATVAATKDSTIRDISDVMNLPRAESFPVNFKLKRAAAEGEVSVESDISKRKKVEQTQ